MASQLLTPAALQAAVRAWHAFRAPTPDGLGAVAATRSSELRFLGEAFDRLSREYPSTQDGLSLTTDGPAVSTCAVSIRSSAGTTAPRAS